ncbi:MAG: RNA polymerase sigma factor [Clostridia bacterium]|nr:RNA polymerase sigma factor [Clostridia bacterium]
MQANDILPYVEPIFRFCCRRLNSRYDAEDLAGEIICHILDGIGRYPIDSPDAWVWKIAHNRYARFIEARRRSAEYSSDADLYEMEDYCQIDEESLEVRYEPVFRSLHTLSAEYRNIFVDHYIGGMAVKALSGKYALPETTIKWRLNVGRQKIRERIGDHEMDKVYQRINWNTTCCNGSIDTDRYLHTQLARAICLAAYEEPLTVEEISLATGIPTLYIEDELPRLEHGEAIKKIGSKYAADFIIFSLKNRAATETAGAPLVSALADQLEDILQKGEKILHDSNFYGHDFGMARLGYILIPYLIRRKRRALQNDRLHLSSGPFPPRRDGGYGWFIVEETADESENCAPETTGCNAAGNDSGSKSAKLGHIYYYNIARYFNYNIYHNGGTQWLCANDIPQNSVNGIIAPGSLTEEDIIRLIQANLIIRDGSVCKLNFPCFTREQFDAFVSAFTFDNARIDDLLSKWLLSVRRNFEQFVPKRLHDQINQWISCYSGSVIGRVIEELIRRGALEKPDDEIPLTNGVFYVEGDYIQP